MAYLAAVSDAEAVRDAVRTLDEDSAGPGRIYVHRFPTGVLLAGQRAARRMTRGEVRRWRRWIAEAGDGVTDPAYARGDPLPAYADVAQWLRHPRSFLRKAAAP
jgi:hypothetical protein